MLKPENQSQRATNPLPDSCALYCDRTLVENKNSSKTNKLYVDSVEETEIQTILIDAQDESCQRDSVRSTLPIRPTTTILSTLSDMMLLNLMNKMRFCLFGWEWRPVKLFDIKAVTSTIPSFRVPCCEVVPVKSEQSCIVSANNHSEARLDKPKSVSLPYPQSPTKSFASTTAFPMPLTVQAFNSSEVQVTDSNCDNTKMGNAIPALQFQKDLVSQPMKLTVLDEVETEVIQHVCSLFASLSATDQSASEVSSRKTKDTTKGSAIFFGNVVKSEKVDVNVERVSRSENVLSPPSEQFLEALRNYFLYVASEKAKHDQNDTHDDCLVRSLASSGQIKSPSTVHIEDKTGNVEKEMSKSINDVSIDETVELHEVKLKPVDSQCSITPVPSKNVKEVCEVQVKPSPFEIKECQNNSKTEQSDHITTSMRTADSDTSDISQVKDFKLVHLQGQVKDTRNSRCSRYKCQKHPKQNKCQLRRLDSSSFSYVLKIRRDVLNVFIQSESSLRRRANSFVQNQTASVTSQNDRDPQNGDQDETKILYPEVRLDHNHSFAVSVRTVLSSEKSQVFNIQEQEKVDSNEMSEVIVQRVQTPDRTNDMSQVRPIEEQQTAECVIEKCKMSSEEEVKEAKNVAIVEGFQIHFLNDVSVVCNVTTAEEGPSDTKCQVSSLSIEEVQEPPTAECVTTKCEVPLPSIEGEREPGNVMAETFHEVPIVGCVAKKCEVSSPTVEEVEEPGSVMAETFYDVPTAECVTVKCKVSSPSVEEVKEPGNIMAETFHNEMTPEGVAKKCEVSSPSLEAVREPGNVMVETFHEVPIAEGVAKKCEVSSPTVEEVKEPGSVMAETFYDVPTAECVTVKCKVSSPSVEEVKEPGNIMAETFHNEMTPEGVAKKCEVSSPSLEAVREPGNVMAETFHEVPIAEGVATKCEVSSSSSLETVQEPGNVIVEAFQVEPTSECVIIKCKELSSSVEKVNEIENTETGISVDEPKALDGVSAVILVTPVEEVLTAGCVATTCEFSSEEEVLKLGNVAPVTFLEKLEALDDECAACQVTPEGVPSAEYATAEVVHEAGNVTAVTLAEGLDLQVLDDESSAYEITSVKEPLNQPANEECKVSFVENVQVADNVSPVTSAEINQELNDISAVGKLTTVEDMQTPECENAKSLVSSIENVNDGVRAMCQVTSEEKFHVTENVNTMTEPMKDVSIIRGRKRSHAVDSVNMMYHQKSSVGDWDEETKILKAATFITPSPVSETTSSTDEKKRESSPPEEAPQKGQGDIKEALMSQTIDLLERGIVILTDTGLFKAIVNPSCVSRVEGTSDLHNFSRTFTHYDTLPLESQKKIIERAARISERFKDSAHAVPTERPIFTLEASDLLPDRRIFEYCNGDSIMEVDVQPDPCGLPFTGIQPENAYQPFVNPFQTLHNSCFQIKLQQLSRVNDIEMIDEEEFYMDVDGNSEGSQIMLMEYDDCICQLCLNMKDYIFKPLLASSSSSRAFNQVPSVVRWPISRLPHWIPKPTSKLAVHKLETFSFRDFPPKQPVFKNAQSVSTLTAELKTKTKSKYDIFSFRLEGQKPEQMSVDGENEQKSKSPFDLQQEEQGVFPCAAEPKTKTSLSEYDTFSFRLEDQKPEQMSVVGENEQKSTSPFGVQQEEEVVFSCVAEPKTKTLLSEYDTFSFRPENQKPEQVSVFGKKEQKSILPFVVQPEEQGVFPCVAEPKTKTSLSEYDTFSFRPENQKPEQVSVFGKKEQKSILPFVVQPEEQGVFPCVAELKEKTSLSEYNTFGFRLEDQKPEKYSFFGKNEQKSTSPFGVQQEEQGVFPCAAESKTKTSLSEYDTFSFRLEDQTPEQMSVFRENKQTSTLSLGRETKQGVDSALAVLPSEEKPKIKTAQSVYETFSFRLEDQEFESVFGENTQRLTFTPAYATFDLDDDDEVPNIGARSHEDDLFNLNEKKEKYIDRQSCEDDLFDLNDETEENSTNDRLETRDDSKEGLPSGEDENTENKKTEKSNNNLVNGSCTANVDNISSHLKEADISERTRNNVLWSLLSEESLKEEKPSKEEGPSEHVNERKWFRVTVRQTVVNQKKEFETVNLSSENTETVNECKDEEKFTKAKEENRATDKASQNLSLPKQKTCVVKKTCEWGVKNDEATLPKFEEELPVSNSHKVSKAESKPQPTQVTSGHASAAFLHRRVKVSGTSQQKTTLLESKPLNQDNLEPAPLFKTLVPINVEKSKVVSLKSLTQRRKSKPTLSELTAPYNVKDSKVVSMTLNLRRKTDPSRKCVPTNPSVLTCAEKTKLVSSPASVPIGKIDLLSKTTASESLACSDAESKRENIDSLGTDTQSKSPFPSDVDKNKVISSQTFDPRGKIDLLSKTTTSESIVASDEKNHKVVSLNIFTPERKTDPLPDSIQSNSPVAYDEENKKEVSKNIVKGRKEDANEKCDDKRDTQISKPIKSEIKPQTQSVSSQKRDLTEMLEEELLGEVEFANKFHKRKEPSTEEAPVCKHDEKSDPGVQKPNEKGSSYSRKKKSKSSLRKGVVKKTSGRPKSVAKSVSKDVLVKSSGTLGLAKLTKTVSDAVKESSNEQCNTGTAPQLEPLPLVDRGMVKTVMTDVVVKNTNIARCNQGTLIQSCSPPLEEATMVKNVKEIATDNSIALCNQETLNQLNSSPLVEATINGVTDIANDNSIAQYNQDTPHQLQSLPLVDPKIVNTDNTSINSIKKHNIETPCVPEPPGLLAKSMDMVKEPTFLAGITDSTEDGTTDMEQTVEPPTVPRKPIEMIKLGKRILKEIQDDDEEDVKKCAVVIAKQRQTEVKNSKRRQWRSTEKNTENQVDNIPKRIKISRTFTKR